MTTLIEIRDREEKIVRLTKERWSHILQEHPEMSDQMESIIETVRNARIIKQSHRDSMTKFYYRYKKERREAPYLLVAIKYLNGEGYIITSFYTNKIKGLP